MTLTDNMIFTIAFLVLVFPLGCYLVARGNSRKPVSPGTGDEEGGAMATRRGKAPAPRGATRVIDLDSRRTMHPDPKDWPPEAA